MYILYVFLLMCVIEAIFFYRKRNRVIEYADFLRDIESAVGARRNEKYNLFVAIVGRFLSVSYKLLWILIPIILVINILVALIAGGILNLIF